MRLGNVVARTRQKIGQKRDRRSDEQREDKQNLPDQRAKRVHAIPAEHGGEEPCDRSERPAQVIEHLPTTERGHTTLGVDDVRDELPVAACPAMLARNFDFVTGREILDQLDIGDKSATRERPFEKVVGENRVFFDTALQRCLEGIDVIEALAGERTFSGQVLIDVGDGEDVRVETAADREDALEDRGFRAGRQRRRDARLHQAVALDHLVGFRIENRAVDGVVHLADELGRRIADEAGIGIERHHILDVCRNRVGALKIGRVTVAAQQQVQLMQLSALALPAHPYAFVRIEQATTVEKEEAVACHLVLVTRVERHDFALGIIEDFEIGFGLLDLTVAPVGQQREIDFALRVGEIMNLEIAHQFIDRIAVGDQARHDDERLCLFRNAFLEFVTDKPRRFDEVGYDRVEQAGRTFRSRQREHQEQEENDDQRDRGLNQEMASNRQGKHGQQDHRSGNCEPVQLAIGTHRPLQDRRMIIDGCFQFLAVTADDECAYIGLAHVRVFCGRFLRKLDGGLGDFGFAALGKARELFDAVAIGVARTEIERFVIGMLAKQLVDLRDVLEPDAPFRIDDETEALDDIAHRHVAGGETALLRLRNGLDIRADLGQALFDPLRGERRRLRGIAHAVEELRRKRVVAHQIRNTGQHLGAFGLVVQADDLVGDVIGALAHVARTVDAGRDTAQVLDQHEADEGRQRPELADFERFVFLETLDHGGQRLAVHARMGMRDVEPCERQNTRHLLSLDDARRQLLEEFFREVATDFLDRLFDDVIVVEQPFGRRRDRGARIHIESCSAIDAKDFLLVVGMLLEELEGHEAGKIFPLAAAEPYAAVSQVVYRQIARTDRIIVIDLLDVCFARGAGLRSIKGHGHASE
ncbi:hypothetical protein D3C71_651380 [compost metagenome]